MPERTCVACRTRRPKSELVRVVRRPDGTVVLEDGATIEGRGAYLCADAACWQLALRRGAIERALHSPLPRELKKRMEHGAVATDRLTTGRQAPVTMLGGSHGS